jgi:DnaJ-class molecular chaperone
MNVSIESQKNCEVVCAFCGGSGHDPFGLLSPLSTCEVCGGSGHCTLLLPITKCAYCGGCGIHPHSRMTCTSCRGVGVAHVAPDAEICPACKGSGRAANYLWPDSQLSCSECGGVGKVSPVHNQLFRSEKHAK